MNWRPRTLAECAKFQSGGTPSKSNPAYWGGDIPWVGSGEMSQSFIYDTELRLTSEGAQNGTRAISENTVLVVVRGMSLAKEFRIAITRRPMTFNQDVKALQCAEDIYPQFLFYALKARKEYIRDLATEASHGTKKLETSTLNAVEILVPETIEEQQAIAEVALNYDELIENNRRRIALLEEAARQLYKEWFVRFRFPAMNMSKSSTACRRDGTGKRLKRSARRSEAVRHQLKKPNTGIMTTFFGLRRQM